MTEIRQELCILILYICEWRLVIFQKFLKTALDVAEAYCVASVLNKLMKFQAAFFSAGYFLVDSPLQHSLILLPIAQLD